MGSPGEDAGSNVHDRVAWTYWNTDGADCTYAGTSRSPRAVARKLPNELGLFDMSGNLGEWCWDGPPEYRYYRGGYWTATESFSTVTRRLTYPPNARQVQVGFRVVRNSNG